MLADVYGRLCCEVRPYFPDPYAFSFYDGCHLPNSQVFQRNEIKTTKYNAFNFLPKSIITQYQRLANLYFLIVASISTIPDVSPLNPGLIWAPLVLVLFISIVKELYQDYQRYQMDKEVNDIKQVEVLRSGQIQVIKWKEVMVGDFCRIKDDQFFPADLILISSSHSDGVAYIETASLDGQQTSKIRYAFPEFNSRFGDEQIKKLAGKFHGDAPDASFNHFRGTLEIQGRKYSLSDNSQLLFRGAKLKNTEWIWGLAVYTGQCTKIMMNGQAFQTKFSTLERKLNYLLVSMLVIQLVACFLLASLSTNRVSSLENSVYMLWPAGYTRSKTFVMNFLMFFVEFSSAIPISLVVSIEIAKTAQSYFIDFDQLMYSNWRKRKVYARVANLNEQLGQVEYVFCDKTGTLTKNKLIFHTAVIGNQFYQFNYNPQNKQYTCEAFARDMLQKSRVADDYLMCLLLCNNVSTIEKEGVTTYESESPDQLALIAAAKSMDYVLVKRDKNSMLVQINGQVERVEIVATFPFTSERKRMSIIAKWKGSYVLFTKGADNVIAERTKTSVGNIQNSVDVLSYKGLRVLLVSIRLLSQREVLQMLHSLQEAEMRARQLMIEEYADHFERDLNVIGATGLLDELQDGVPQTLSDFQRAGIRTWMLTGDKLETAMEVAKSCNLIAPDYQVVLMRMSNCSIRDIMEESRKRINPIKKYSLLIEGSVLGKIINDPLIQKEFAEFTLFFSSVICCRMLPVQKSQAVSMVKRHLQKICLAIGDGGNDVSMIKEAHIGVGIYGEEGMNAVQACDYAIPEFRMIWRLLFVHGRWNYMRISQMILYFLYKSIVFTVPRFLFAFNNAFSGYPIYEDYYIALYNVLFTALPLLARALLQQDVNYVTKKRNIELINVDTSEMCKAEEAFLPAGFTINTGLRKLFPKIYYLGQKNEIFNLKECIIWIIEAMVMGVCVFYIIFNSLNSTSIKHTGINTGLHVISVTVFAGVIMVDTVKLCMLVQHWTVLLFCVIIFTSLTPFVAALWIINYFFNRPVAKIMVICFTTLKTYLSVIVILIILIGINGIFVYLHFHSNRILKRMKIAIEEDLDMIDFFSNASEACLSDDQRKTGKEIKKVNERNKIPVLSADIQEEEILQQ